MGTISLGAIPACGYYSARNSAMGGAVVQIKQNQRAWLLWCKQFLLFLS